MKECTVLVLSSIFVAAWRTARELKFVREPPFAVFDGISIGAYGTERESDPEEKDEGREKGVCHFGNARARNFSFRTSHVCLDGIATSHWYMVKWVKVLFKQVL